MKKYEKPSYSVLKLDDGILVCASHCGMILVSSVCAEKKKLVD